MEKWYGPSAGARSIFVYCDLIEDQIVGDSLSPLLRIVPVTVRQGKFQHTVYNHVHYYPLSTNNFHTIEISLRDEFGNPIPFQAGPATVTLHIRRRHAEILP